MRKIGFIGVGIMGKSMVRNLMKAGFEVHIYARTRPKVEDVISEGAVFHDSIKDCAGICEAVITIVGFPQDVEEVYFDAQNILDSAAPGAYLIDMTTTSPMLAKKIGFDPSVMASPFITTIVDAISLLIYFRFATVLLHLH